MPLLFRFLVILFPLLDPASNALSIPGRRRRSTRFRNSNQEAVVVVSVIDLPRCVWERRGRRRWCRNRDDLIQEFGGKGGDLLVARGEIYPIVLIDHQTIKD
ncbi:Uncharacterized protein Rs2_04260 [Raphanus sativus]|nr:Uncharacterized protein Rs2_04260 [Raphanus sativus]